MISKPIVTILTPVYNGENTIGKSIQSVLNQSFIYWQMVIVNDGSTDNTLLEIEKFNDKRIKIVNLDENKGRPFARQKALEHINTEYFCFLDADDLYYPNKLETQIDFMKKNPQYALLSNAIGMVDKNENLIGVLTNNEGELFFDEYYKYDKIPHASSIIRTSVLGGVSYDMTLKYTQDQDFLRRLLYRKKYYFQDKINYIYTREGSFSFHKYKESLFLEKKSLKKVDSHTFRRLKRSLITYMKIGMVFLLNTIKLEKIYLKKIGIEPSTKQIQEYEKFINM